MKIGSVDLKREVLLVAEIGNNHEGRYAVAEELVRQAAACGVQAVKFQTFRTEHYVSRGDSARFKRLKSFELSGAEFRRLSELAHSLGLLFISTPFDLGSAQLLEPLVDGYKIASGDNSFYPLIANVARTGKPLIISTGLSDYAQVTRAVDFVRKQWKGQPEGPLALLHCVSSYPVPPEQVNLRAIPFLAARFGLPIGYSDHTIGLDAAVLAVALGARIVEKHFTLDKAFSDFRDHQLSADPNELRDLVRRVQLGSAMLGEFDKKTQPCEAQSATALRRSIVAGADLPRGHRLEACNLTWIRPGGGLAPGEEARLLGRSLKQDVRFGDLLTESDVG
jgi:sialic acid synthase SpsE